MRHHSSILVRAIVSDLVRIVRSYNAGKVDKGDPLWILCAHTIAIRVSNVDVHIETLVNIGRILRLHPDDKIQSMILLTGRLKFCMRSSLCLDSISPTSSALSAQ